LSAKNYLLTTEKDLDNMSDQELEELYDRLKKEQLQP
jgi:ribosomal protein L29